MNAEVIKSQDYHKKSREAADILAKSGNHLTPEVKRDLEVQKARGEVHRRVEAITGSEQDIFVNKAAANDNVAGFYNGKSHLSEVTLDSMEWALHVKKHEDIHGKAITNLEIGKYMSSEHAKSLAAALNLQNINDIDWIEGFTELINILENKKNERCAYLKKEVPAAMELEKLCKEHMKESLVQSFKSKNAGLFYYLLKKMADCILQKENIRKKLAA